MRTITPRTDPLLGQERRPHFVEIFFRSRRLDREPFVTMVAYANPEDLTEVIREAAMANENDPVKALYRYMVRVYEYDLDRRTQLPRKGRRIIDFVPRGEEQGGHGH